MKRLLHLILLVFLIVFISSCSKNNDTTGTGASAPTVYVPTIVTTNVLSITSSGAVAGGEILDSSSDGIMEKGVCFGTSSGPTISNRKISTTSGSNDFSITLSNLSIDSTYYVRAYAINNSGIGYGNEISFKTAFAVGQYYQGGIIFYVDIRGQHGLIVAQQDAGSSTWGCAGTVISGASNLGIGTGQQNTTSIKNQCAASAAYMCDTVQLNGYTDWFLPSHDELGLMFDQRRAVGNFSETFYWSSTQYDSNNAYYQNFATGSQSQTGKGNTALVRPIRVF